MLELVFSIIITQYSIEHFIKCLIYYRKGLIIQFTRVNLTIYDSNTSYIIPLFPNSMHAC